MQRVFDQESRVRACAAHGDECLKRCHVEP